MVFCESEGGDDVIDVWKYVKNGGKRFQLERTKVSMTKTQLLVENSGDNEKRFQIYLGYSLRPTSAKIVA